MKTRVTSATISSRIMGSGVLARAEMVSTSFLSSVSVSKGCWPRLNPKSEVRCKRRRKDVSATLRFLATKLPGMLKVLTMWTAFPMVSGIARTVEVAITRLNSSSRSRGWVDIIEKNKMAGERRGEDKRRKRTFYVIFSEWNSKTDLFRFAALFH